MIGLACLCGGLALVAAGGALMLASAGMPTVVALLTPAALAGGLMFAAVSRWQATLQPAAEVQALQNQVTDLEAAASMLRHDLRGVLSPALMVADRLVNNPDPAVRRAGDAVVRSVDRATALLTASNAPGHEDGSSPA